jgi:hypothetical protein
VPGQRAFPERDTVIVAARVAYPEYRRWAAYGCQSGRAFHKRIVRMGFYYDRAIQPEIALILDRRDQVVFSADTVRRLRATAGPFDVELAAAIESLLHSTPPRKEGFPYQVFLLSPPDGQDTIRLDRPVENTAKDHNGRYTAWTRGQRYTLSSALRQNPRTTAELEERGG